MSSLPEIKGKSAVKRKQMAIVLFGLAGFLAVLIGGLYMSDPNRKNGGAAQNAMNKPPPDVTKSFKTPASGRTDQEVWVSKSEADLKQLQSRYDDMERRLKEAEDRGSRGSTEPPPPSSFPQAFSSTAVPNTRDNLPPPPPPSAISSRAQTGTMSSGQVGPDGQPVRQPGIQVIDLSEPEVSDPGKAAAVPKRTSKNYLPAGSFAKVKLLSGMDAPTGALARTQPTPVFIVVKDRGTLPNDFRSNVRECKIIGAAYGDLSAERAYIRLETLSCVTPDDEIVEVAVKGYVAGEDGKAGLRGDVVSKQGQMIGKAALAGLASGLGTSISQAYTQVSTNPLGAVQTVDPKDIGKQGLAQGAATALEKIADFYIARAEELFPVIEIGAGRTVDIVITEGVPLGDAFERAALALEE